MPSVSGKTLVAAMLIASMAMGCASNPSPSGAPAAVPAAAVTAGSARVDRARIDMTLKGFIDRGELVGSSALVYEKGRESYFGAFGLADREAGKPMARDTLVQIFSMTKPVTGVALLTLYEKGRFDLDDPVAKFLPEMANLRVYAGEDSSGKSVLETTARPVTIRDLMRHTAGLVSGDDTSKLGELFRKADPMNVDNTLAEMAKRLGTVPLSYQPGTRWLYSNAVDVQAFLVERLSGEPFDQFLRTHIFEPLRMNDTSYLVPPAKRPRLAAMYTRNDDGTMVRMEDEPAFGFNTREHALKPGGYGLVSSLDDYMRFARMLLNEGELDGARILKPETVRLIATNVLAESITERSWLPSKGQVGFGIDVAVRLAPPASAEENPGEVGEFFWDGAANTLFWVDPRNQIAAVLFTQYRPFGQLPVSLHKAMRDAIYR
jgi:CubicO group peptidase (beta-lactamase class C family)